MRQARMTVLIATQGIGLTLSGNAFSGRIVPGISEGE